MEIKLSIIVPVYNVEKYVKKCLTSLIINNLSYEVIVINDGSTDSSGEICRKFCNGKKQFHYFEKNNNGLSEARNDGINKSSGKYIMFVDSDDYLDSKELIKIFKYLDLECEIICFDHNEIDEEGNYITSGYCYDDYCLEPMNGLKFYCNRIIKKSFPAAVCFNIYKASLIKNNSIFFKKGIYHEDEEWTPRIFLISKSVIHINSVLYLYVRRNESITNSSKTIKKILDLIETYNELEKLFKKSINLKNFESKYIYDYFARQYMNIYCGNIEKKTYNLIKKNIDYKFIKRNSRLISTKMKYIVFRFSIKLYNLLKKI